MTDLQTEHRLRAALRARADDVRPTPALPGILHRARATPRRAGLRTWAPGLAAAAVAAVTVLVVDGGSDSATTEPAETASTIEAGSQQRIGVFVIEGDYSGLRSGGVTVTSSGDLGLDAVRALQEERDLDGGLWNPWTVANDRGGDKGPGLALYSDVPEVVSVDQGGGVVRIDFAADLPGECQDVFVSNGPVRSPAAQPGLQAYCVSPGRQAVQQLVWTVTQALRTEDPVLITVAGEPVTDAFGADIVGPVRPDPSLVDGQILSPHQGATVSSPVSVSGETTVSTGTVDWLVEQAGDVVRRGSEPVRGTGVVPYEFSVDLPSGSYTVVVRSDNEAWPARGLGPWSAPRYLDITVAGDEISTQSGSST